MTEDKTFDVDPAYGGADHPHPHSDPEVEEGYGGENAPHPHDPRYPGVDPSYGGDSSPGYVHRTGLDEDEAQEESQD
ncbi:hypothetical protein [Micropruina sp.]|uniref:hypothetical protein n=1 Tax=Micropruina sp. TaxID=2737536 RepID=UPI00261F1D07|nr:hypothetical protein [Micropruina sp.]